MAAIIVGGVMQGLRGWWRLRLRLQGEYGAVHILAVG
jgi:hypothetical protein